MASTVGPFEQIARDEGRERQLRIPVSLSSSESGRLVELSLAWHERSLAPTASFGIRMRRKNTGRGSVRRDPAAQGEAMRTCDRRVAMARFSSCLLLGSNRTRSAHAEASYDRLASSYDRWNRGGAARTFGIPDLREELVREAKGEVLEVAVGSGINLSSYEWNGSNLSRVTGVDISKSMLEVAEARARELDVNDAGTARFRAVQADARDLPFPDEEFDTVLDTFSMCVLQDDALQVLREMKRVCKPTGRVLLLEHSRSPFIPLAGYQDLTAAGVIRFGKGCAWNQDIMTLVQQSGLNVINTQEKLQGLLVLIEASP